MSRPKEKKRNKKIPRRVHLSVSPSLPPSCYVRRRTHASPPPINPGPRASHPRLPCRPFTLPSLRLLIRVEADSRSPPQTLTLAAIAAAASSARRCRRRFAVAGERRLDSLRGELHLPPRDPFPSSLGPLFLPTGPPTSVAARRRFPPPGRRLVAAPRLHHRRWGSPPPPLPRARRPWPAPASLRRAAVRRRRHMCAPRAWARPGAGSRQALALTRPGGAAQPPGPTCRWPGWLPSGRPSIFARVS